MTYQFAPIREELVETVWGSCRLCGSRRYRHLFRTDNIRRRAKKLFDLVRCEDCGLAYFNPSPTHESLKYYYEDYMAHVPERISFLERCYYRLFRTPRQRKCPGKLLDIGCGNGKYLDFMRSRGWKVTGVDSGPGCDFPRKSLGLTVYDGHLWEHEFPENSFDLITLWFVIEHVWDPVRLVVECKRILKPGGELIISTLNSGSFEARIFKRYWWHLLAPEHLSQFDVRSLRGLLNQCDLKILSLRHEFLCGGILGSIQNMLDAMRIPLFINSNFFKALFAPLDFLCAVFRSSGLITVFARK